MTVASLMNSRAAASRLVEPSDQGEHLQVPLAERRVAGRTAGGNKAEQGH